MSSFKILDAQIIIGGYTIIKYLLIAIPTILGVIDKNALINTINKPESNILRQKLKKEAKANKL